ncbi:MAG: hypothetical protein M3Y57_16295 [Acidobacteriota bacterium]|nr:hypothetical protein [Acidobacteriota bacterium]
MPKRHTFRRGVQISRWAGERVVGSCRLKTYAVRLDEQQRIVLTLRVAEMQEPAM